MHTCENCKVGTMREPPDQHPAYIQCDSCMAIQLTYVPMPYQEGMHQVDTGGDLDIISCFGGFGSGKSRSTLQEFLMRALENPRGSGLFGAQTLGQLKKTTLKTWFEEICPPPLVESWNKTDGIMKLINGFTIFIVSTDEEQKIRSLNLGLVHLEEVSGIKKSIYTQILSRMRDPFTKNKAVIVCSNPSNTWIKDEFVDNEDRKNPSHPQHANYNPYIRTFIWKTALNTYLPPNFIEMNTKNRPEWYRKKYFEGDFSFNSGMVYPEIHSTFIDPYPVNPEKTDRFGIPKDFERVVALDFGIRNETAVLFGAINPKEGELIIYNEYYVREKTLPQHAAALKPLINEIQSGLLRFMVIDPACKNRMNDVINGKSIISHFQEYGLYFHPGNNNIEYGLAKVSSYIELRKLKIYKTCFNTIKEGIGYLYPEVDMDNAEENADEKPIKAQDHLMDALKYMVARLPDDPEHLKSASYTPPRSYSEYNNYDTINYDDEIPEKFDDFLAYY
jgi:PBSX family phage terminase large subunit